MASTDKYLALITGQHRGKPKFAATVLGAVAPLVDLQNLIGTFPAAYDLDSAVGVQLDAVGLWVGRSRTVATPLAGVYFSWDTEGLGWDQGVWKGPYDPDTGVVSLDDETYRVLLRAKIAANSWDGTLPGAKAVLDWAFNDPDTHVFVQDNMDMSMTIGVAGKLPTPIVRALITGGYIPVKPEGVRLNYAVTTVDGAPLFGFDMNNSQVAGWDTGAWASAS